jgi:hypothetical protein
MSVLARLDCPGSAFLTTQRIQAGACITLEGLAVELVPTRLGHQVDHTACPTPNSAEDELASTETDSYISGMSAEKPDRNPHVIDLLAVEKEVVGARTRAVDLNIDTVVETGTNGIVDDLDARNGRSEFIRANRKYRQLCDISPINHTGKLTVLCIDRHRISLDVHGIGCGTDYKLDIV